MRPRRLYVLDTNVLMHDPSCIFRFQEHDIFLPMVVLEELDAGKKGISEAARNVRQVSRFLDDMMHDVGNAQIDSGLPIPGLHRDAGAAAVAEQATAATGRLFSRRNRCRCCCLKLCRAIPPTTIFSAPRWH